jgi:hypothetical protein
MQNTSFIAEGSEQLRDIGAPPEVYGVLAFVLLAILLGITLAFGKGRPHS